MARTPGPDLPVASRWREGARFNGALVETVVRKRGLTWAQVARAVGCRPRQLWRWRTGRVLPGALAVFALADLLDLAPGELYLPAGEPGAQAEAFRSWKARWQAAGRE